MNTVNKAIAVNAEHQFCEVISIILEHKRRAATTVNNEILLTAWHVGGYVSRKLKSEEWGSKIVIQLAEYIRKQRPELKGYSRSNIYNMVMFYEEYSSEAFKNTISNYLKPAIVQTEIGHLQTTHSKTLHEKDLPANQIVQLEIGQMPEVLYMTTYSNHLDILSLCRNNEMRLFYILYAYKEKLTRKELQRCISNQTYEGLLSNKKNLSKGLLTAYPDAQYIFKDTLFVDFLGLPRKHSERKLRNGLIEHMKEFILELGKDFLFVDQEYTLNVGNATFKADLLFFHRGLQCLVAVELKKTKFHPRDLGQLEFYLEALDRDVKRSNENPSIGIILCPEANNIVVEYAMNRSMSPTLIAEYKRLLIPQERMQQELRDFCEFFTRNK